MKKKSFKFLSVIMALLFATPLLGGCGSDDNRPIDDTKTQLSVSVVPSGYGSDWLKQWALDFEKEFANTSFEEGKLGVQVTTSTDAPGGNNLLSYMPGVETEVIFTEDVDYYTVANAGHMHDIKDVVQADMTDVGEAGQTIEGKMSSQYIDYFKKDGHYYALPFNVNYTGIVYDVDVWTEEGLYFAGDVTKATENDECPAKKNGSNYVFTGSNGTLSAGPDGKKGTYDDGLPATYEQFFALCNEMATQRAITPIVWAGQYQFYMYRMLYCLWANNEGAEQMRLNYTYDGIATNLIKEFDAGGNPVMDSATTITTDNGYELQRQAGRYYALSFVEQLVKNTNYYDSNYCFGSYEQGDAHLEFLNGAFDTQSGKRTAMLVEGCHWENEATDYFNRLEKKYGTSAKKENRNFAFLPFPHPTDEQIGQKAVTCDAYNSALFINGKIAANKEKVAETFVKYIHTRSALASFTEITSLIRPYDFTLTDAELGSMSNFGRSVYENYKNSDIVTPYSSNVTAIKNYSMFNPLSNGIWTTTINGTTYNVPSSTFNDNSSVTAKNYYEGIVSSKTASWWNGIK